MFTLDSDCINKTTSRREWALYSLQSLSAAKLARIVNQVFTGAMSLFIIRLVRTRKSN